MKDYANFYSIYNSPPIILLRIFILLVLFWFAITSKIHTPLIFLSVFLMFEVFFRFKISTKTPLVKLSDNDGKDMLSSATLKTMSILISSKDSSSIVRKLLKLWSIKFVLEKSDVLNVRDIQVVNIDKKDLIRDAFNLAKNLKGTYITPIDVFASYVLLTEDETKVLFNKNLKKEEFLQIVLWARTRFVHEEVLRPYKVEFWGEGIAEGWVTGWTIETQKYMFDLTSEVLKRRPIILGREKEFEELIEAMYKGKSALLVGEAGSGRREVAETLGFESFVGNLSGSLYHQRLYQLLVDALIAGTENAGQLEQRLDETIAELSHAGNIIIFLPSFENILGSSSFHLDLSGVLTPYIENGAIRIIGTITPGAYKKFVEGRKTFSNNLEIVKIDEPDEANALHMLFKKSEDLETSKVKISYKAISATLKYSKKYLPDRVLPGAAVTLLKDSITSAELSGKTIVEEKDVVEKVEEKTNIAIGKPEGKEKQLLLHLEEEIHKRVIGQEEAVGAISEALRRVRTGLSDVNKPISFLFMGPTGVGKTETAKTLARIYFGGEEKMIRLDMSEYTGDDSLKRLLGSLPGEGEAEGELTDQIRNNPFSLVLLDEFEKANPQILNLFLQILDDGRLTDNRGRTVSFTNAIIIATSNAGSEFIREEVEKGTKVDKKFQQNLIDLLQKQNTFKPELLNRFNGVIVFKPLGVDEIKQVTQILLNELKKKMKEQDVVLDFDNSIIEKIIKEGFDQQFGARPIRRYIQDNIEDPIAKKLLKDEIKRGDKITISVDQNNAIII
ncbi:MAG: ATP-dependent Clp protease ATP-binding subunit [Patescibacteria group bacterium]